MDFEIVFSGILGGGDVNVVWTVAWWNRLYSHHLFDEENTETALLKRERGESVGA